MSTYKQLPQEQRYQISAFLKAKFSNAHIARELHVHPSNIGRQLRRNHDERSYRPKQAHQKALYHRQVKSNARRIKAQTWQRV